MKTNKANLFLFLMTWILIACQTPNQREAILEKELALAQKELALEIEKGHIKDLQDSLSRLMIKETTIKAQSETKEKKNAAKKEQKLEIPKKVEKEKKEVKTVITTPKNETSYYYYSNKQISAKVNVWENGKQKIELFDRRGILTFELENIRLSYQQSNTLSFHSNGAVKSSFIYMNPGASRYWYETIIQFDENNQPLNKVSKQMPSESILEAMGETYLWSSQKKDWILQEVIQCQPVNTQ